MALLLLPSLFQSCDIQSLFDEMSNTEETYSYSNGMGGKTTEYGTKSWATLVSKAEFLNKFDEVGSDLNYSQVSDGVRDGERFVEVYFERGTTDDEATAYIKKLVNDGYILSLEDGRFKGYKVESDGIKYEFEYGYNEYLYRKTEISSLKKDAVAKQYSEDLKSQSNTKINANWSQIKNGTPWVQVFPEVEGVFKLSKTDASGNELKLYGDMDYSAIDKLINTLMFDFWSSRSQILVLPLKAISG